MMKSFIASLLVLGQILEAIKMRDPSRAGELLDEHFDDVRARIKLAMDGLPRPMTDT